MFSLKPIASTFALAMALLLCTPGQAVAAASEVPPPADLVGLRAELAERVASGELPSVAIAVLSQGEIAWLEAIGWADREERRPATVETPYGLASLGKSITATGVITLVERGELDLDRPINSG